MEEATRREFLKRMGGVAVLGPLVMPTAPAAESWFNISLAEWSLHKPLFDKKIDNLQFPEIAKKQFNINIVEYVSTFFKDKAKDQAYLNDLLQRAKDHGVSNHLIMVDGEGDLGNINKSERDKAVENHYKWVEAAKFLGCQTIRVNAHGEGSADEISLAAIDGLGKLGEFGGKAGINIVVENHGGYSSNGQWLANVMKQVNLKEVGTLPDFGNFCLKRKEGDYTNCLEEYDRYKGVTELMPYAKGVSAKTYDFNESGDAIETDYVKMMKIVKDSGFKGIVGIEYEGSKLDETEGIKSTSRLLKRFQ